MKLVKLTSSNNQEPVYLNPLLIEAVGSGCVYVTGGKEPFYLVEESQEKIVSLVNEAMK